MRVQVKLFATLARYRPGERPGTPFEVVLPDDATVSELLALVGVPEQEAKVVFVNGRARSRGDSLSSGDQVGIFPPIGGG